MIAVAEIRERLRQHGERIDGKHWSDETVDRLWMWVALVANCGTEWLVRKAEPGQEADRRQFLTELL